jgi:hypothetical protein
MKADLCPVCKGGGKIRAGYGSEKDNEIIECHGCKGKGWVEVESDKEPIQIAPPQIYPNPYYPYYPRPVDPRNPWPDTTGSYPWYPPVITWIT